MSIFSERLKTLRLENNISQAKMAEMLGISPRQYQNQEYGKNAPSLDLLLTISHTFEVSLDYLAGISDNPKINHWWGWL